MPPDSPTSDPFGGSGSGGGGIPSAVQQKLAQYANNPGEWKFSMVGGRLRVENHAGQVVLDTDTSGNPGAYKDALSGMLGQGLDGIIGISEDGSLYVDVSPTGAQNPAPAGVTQSPGSTGPGGAPSGPGPGGGRGAGGAGAGGAGGAGGGGTNSAAAARNADRQQRTTGGGLTATTETTGGGLSLDGVGPIGPPPIDPNAPLGVGGFEGAVGGASAGDQRFNDPGVFSTPDPFTNGLDENSSLNDILLGAMGEQRAGRDSALGISGALATGFEDNELRQQVEGNALALGADPFSLNDETVSRIMGQQGDLIGRNTERLQQASAGRAASAGISRSGIQQGQQDRFDISGMNQLGDAQRGLLVEQATRRPQELASAIQTGSNVFGSQQQQRESIARGAINTLGNSNVSADAAVLGTLASGGTPQVQVGGQGGQYQDSRQGVGQFNPF